VLLACYILTVPAQIYFRAVSGTGDTRTALFIEMATLFFYVGFVYVAIFQMRLSLAISWFSEIVYQGLILLMCLVYFRYSRWQTRRI
jgi:Na+-driven multidrug efflux pump